MAGRKGRKVGHHRARIVRRLQEHELSAGAERLGEGVAAAGQFRVADFRARVVD